jgi:hypothetical protein
LSNDNQILIEEGLEPGEQVFLSIPENVNDLRFVPIDPEIKARILEDQEKEKREREARAQAKKEKIKNIAKPTNTGQGGGDMIFIIE